MAETLDDLVRRVDPDRWLAARFVAEPSGAPAVVALYAFEPRAGPGRRDGLQPAAGRDPPGLVARGRWRTGRGAARPSGAGGAGAGWRAARWSTCRATIAATADLEPAPFADEAALFAYIDGTAGALMAAAATPLDPASPPGPRCARPAPGPGRAWCAPSRRGAARGRRWTPDSWADADEDEMASHVGHRVDAALTVAADELKALPVAAFPAVAYATLVRAYRRHEPGELEKRGRLLAATMRGRI